MSADTLVVRLSSMGDVVLAGAVTGGLGGVVFLTRAAWVPLAARLPGVREVVAWEDVDADRVRLPQTWERIVDLHASPRSRRLCASLQGPVQRVERWDLRRRLRVWLKTGAPPPLVVERYARAAGVPVAPRPWIEGWQGGDALVLCPGAAHATKRWPADRFVALGRRWGGPVRVLGGPGDRALVDHVVAGVGSVAQGVVERGFDRTIAALCEARAVVAGDTGLLHLAGALGVPVLGLFGPTTGTDGFWDPACGVLVERPLPCRPCSLHGGATCPIGDHLCLRDITAEDAWRGLRVLLQARGGSDSEGGLVRLSPGRPA